MSVANHADVFLHVCINEELKYEHKLIFNAKSPSKMLRNC